MKKLFTFLAIAALVVAAPTASQAYFIIDSGTPTNGPLSGAGLGNDSQYLAAEFKLTSAGTITGVEAYLTNLATAFFTGAGTVDFKVYGDSGNFPDNSSTFFSDTVTVTNAGDAAWYGFTNLTLDLAAGDYWLALETGTYDGGMPDGAPNSTGLIAKADTFIGNGSVWEEVQGQIPNYGFRVQALDVHAVPEPASMVLFGAGLAGAAIRRKFSA